MLPYCKDMRMKSVKFSSTLREIELLPLVLTKPAKSGMLILDKNFKLCQVTKKISSHVLSTTKETPLLLVVRITLVVFGKMKRSLKSTVISDFRFCSYSNLLLLCI